MNTYSNLSVRQLKLAVEIREKIEALEAELSHLFNGETASSIPLKGKGKMSASARARIGAAQKARWAKLKGNTVEVAPKKKYKMSASARAAISAAAKARWKKAKAAGKSTL